MQHTRPHSSKQHAVRLATIVLCGVLLVVATPLFARTIDDVKTSTVAHASEIARARDEDGSEVADRVLAEVPRGSIKLTVDRKAREASIEAEFTVDGTDAKDVERRSKLVSLYAVRAADGTVVATPVFPGKLMERDAVKLVIRVPASSDTALKGGEGSVEVRGTSGDLRVSTKSGAITIADHTGLIDARTESGAISIAGATEAVKVKSTSGAISISLADGNDHPFDAESKSGAIAAEVGTSFDGVLRLLSARGEVSLSDDTKRARVVESETHAMTVEFGAAVSHSEMHSMDGRLSITVRAAKPS
ncbi:MAG: DUF4097 family beta strand repeat-containing protein [Limnohabitans sp.]|nr:DUF4097 family beta strand repeat-containing protein [Limnohabitans sp.]